jgi:hypothetical protein
LPDARAIPDLLTADEAARALRVSRDTLLRRRGHDGFPVAFKAGHNTGGATARRPLSVTVRHDDPPPLGHPGVHRVDGLPPGLEVDGHRPGPGVEELDGQLRQSPHLRP